MKLAFISISVFFFCISAHPASAQKKTILLTVQERSYAIDLLKKTQNDFLMAIKGLNDSQLHFKSAPDRWSVAECILHIAAAEKELWAIAEENLSKNANLEARSKIMFTDQDLVKAVEDRSHKSKTFAALEPANSIYKSVGGALAGFKAQRKRTIDFVKNTKVDLRNHVLLLPLGNFDAYQFILLIAAHSNRHTQQINEVKADANFPE